MNEQIKQLAEQALEYAEKNQSADIPRHWFRLYNEKFAELIVAECIAQCWTVSELESKGFVVSECSKRIRKHFGVEE
jgi:hypothetical protein